MLPEHMRGMFLSTTEERVKLLRAGYTGKGIELIYCALNDLDVRRLAWENVLFLAQEEASNGNK